MPKISLISDTHVYRHKGIPKRLDDCLDCFKWAVQTTRENGIKEILHLGDVFHDRTKIHILAYEQVFEIFANNPDINFTILVGNHDMWYLNHRHITSIRPFSALPNVDVISEPTTKNIAGLDMDFAPYSRDPVALLSNFPKKSRILCGHLAVNGAFLNMVKGTKSEVEVESDSDMIPVDEKFFKGWEKVFLGHYHGAQIISGFIEYVGSLLQLTWNEATQQKHMIFLDTETLEKEYVINNFSPKHLLVKSEDIGNVDLDNHFVCVQIKSFETTDVMSIKSNIMEHYKPMDLEIEEESKKQDIKVTQEDQDKFDLANGDIMKRFMSVVGTDDLEEELLYEIGQNIIGGEA